MRFTPEVLHREHEEECIAIDKTIDNTFKLGLVRDKNIERVVCVEVIGVVDVRAVIVVAVGRHESHVLDNRLQ